MLTCRRMNSWNDDREDEEDILNNLLNHNYLRSHLLPVFLAVATGLKFLLLHLLL